MHSDHCIKERMWLQQKYQDEICYSATWEEMALSLQLFFVLGFCIWTCIWEILHKCNFCRPLSECIKPHTYDAVLKTNSKIRGKKEGWFMKNNSIKFEKVRALLGLQTEQVWYASLRWICPSRLCASTGYPAWPQHCVLSSTVPTVLDLAAFPGQQCTRICVCLATVRSIINCCC